jgi:hypothetical protein
MRKNTRFAGWPISEARQGADCADSNHGTVTEQNAGSLMLCLECLWLLKAKYTKAMM